LLQIIADHKDITKIMSQLSSLIGSLKSECGNVIERVEAEGDFSEIWAKDAEAKLAQFLDHEPSLAEYQEQIRLFHVNISAAKCVWVSRSLSPYLLHHCYSNNAGKNNIRMRRSKY